METQNDWREGLKEESIEKASQIKDSYPELPLPEIKEGEKTSTHNITVKFLEEPRRVKNEKLPNGEAFFATVEHEGAKRSIVVPMSLRFQLAVETKKYNLDSLVEKTFTIGASLADTKFGKDKKVYWAQYHGEEQDRNHSDNEE